MGASQRCATRRRGSARLTQTSPTFQLSDETAPVSGWKDGVSFRETSPARFSSPSTGSGREALNRPIAAGAPVEEAVVQAVAAALPELDFTRLHAVAAPVRGARRAVAVAFLRSRHGRFEDLSRGDLDR